MKLKQKIIDFIAAQPRAVMPKEVYKALELQDKDKFKKCIKELKKEGKIVENNKGKLIDPKICGFVPAKIVTFSKGFLFARPLDNSEDIYIASEKSKGAIINDTVMINRIKKTKKGLNGVVERIISHGKNLITGTIIQKNRKTILKSDSLFKYEIPIKRAQLNGAKKNDKVLVKIYHEKKKGNIFGKIQKIYGNSKSAKVCADAVIDKNEIPNIFSKEALSYARKASQIEIKENDLKNRLDLREKLVFTIDGADAKDLDDAISIEKVGSSYILGVHIADVSYYVKKDSVLDLEARERGTSVYFADRVIPMLPKKLSNGICSLNPLEDRLTFSAIIKIDESGKVTSYEFKKSVINSKVRGVYSEVNEILKGNATDSVKEKYSGVYDSIILAKELSDILLLKAKKRGKLDLDSIESKFTLDERGVCVNVQQRVRGEAEVIIENFMLLANECAANFAKAKNVPFIYRVHEEPDPEKVLQLSKMVELLGLKLAKTALKKPRPSHFTTLLKASKKTNYNELVTNRVLRTMSKARYSEKPLGHFGLSLCDYCHFTSPIRRYPDTTIHRILTELVENKDNSSINKKYTDFVKDVAESSSYCEVRAVNAERENEKIYMAEYMSQHLGETFEGKISGVIAKGFFVKLENTVEGFVAIESLNDNNFVSDEISCIKDPKTNKKFSIGDTVSITVSNVNISSGIIDFTININNQ